MAGQRLAADFLQVPAVTRAYTAACVLTTAAVQLELLSPFQLYFNPHLVFRKFQMWTTGDLNLAFPDTHSSRGRNILSFLAHTLQISPPAHGHLPMVHIHEPE